MQKNITIVSQVQKIDVIGDLHGCYDHFIEMLSHLGYTLVETTQLLSHPENRIPVLVGDLTDRGPKPAEVVEFVMKNHQAGKLLMVLGNHDDKLKRTLKGNKVEVKEDLQKTIKAIQLKGQAFVQAVIEWIETLPIEIFFEQLNIRVVHGAIATKEGIMSESHQRHLALHGETTGKYDANNFPERLNWAIDYHGEQMVAYGHSIVNELEWVNNTVDLDLGCFMSGRLGALRMPEKELVEIEM